MQRKKIVPTIFSKGQIGMKLQRMWIEWYKELLFVNSKSEGADFVLVTEKQNKDFVNTGFRTLEAMKETGSIGVAICEYVDSHKEDGKLLVVFMSKSFELNSHVIQKN